jgi:hypothetical protein
MKHLRTHSAETTDGKTFCAFLALIAVSEENLNDYAAQR